jgi:16S rRNA (uracil1498-N3)-methyltransferase
VHRFFVPEFPDSGTVRLPDEEAQHLTRVLRLSSGDLVSVFDGSGREALARIASVASRGVIVETVQPRSPAPEPAVHVMLAQALLKRDKMERVIRDAVMLGVSAIQPFMSRRTDVPRAALKTGARRERWERTVISSVKQCGRAVVPQVLETRELGELLARASTHSRLMFVEPAQPDNNRLVSDLGSLEGQRPSAAVVLIGPEGGWDPEEVYDAAAAGVTLLTLGSRVLRADAAGAAAISVLRYIWRDF